MGWFMLPAQLDEERHGMGGKAKAEYKIECWVGNNGSSDGSWRGKMANCYTLSFAFGLGYDVLYVRNVMDGFRSPTATDEIEARCWTINI